MKNSPRVEQCSLQEYAVALEELPTNNPISFLQAPFYGQWQDRDGKTVVYFRAYDNETIVAAGLAVKYDAPGSISFLYCPYGPTVREWSPELLQSMREFFATTARQTGVTFVRLDSEDLSRLDGVRPIANAVAATASLQPRAEWLLDISGDEESILMGLTRHARYNVRLAERAKAQITFYDPVDAPLDTFMELMSTTAGRDSFSIQSKQYYEAVLQSIPSDNGFVAVCTIDGKPAAVALFAAYDDVMHYVFAGSSNEFRKIAPPYFVIWNAIREAKKRDWTTINFGGISDDVKGQHLGGVTSFKKRFGGYEVTHKNPVDLIYKPLKYTLFKLYKALR